MYPGGVAANSKLASIKVFLIEIYVKMIMHLFENNKKWHKLFHRMYYNFKNDEKWSDNL